MIEVKHLSLPHALTDVSCRIPQNRLVGILGANGAGKSSLLKSIAGIVSPQRGQVLINGRAVTDLDYRQRSRLMAYLAQDTPIRWELRVADVIALGLPTALNADKEADKVRTAAAYFDLIPLLQQPVHTLSGGERARVHLARCLLKDAPILLADEPIAALDPYYQIDMMQHLKALSQTMTCVVVLHHLSLAYRYCDEIILLKSGRVIDSGLTDDVLITENLAKAFAISATIDRANRTIHNIHKLS